MRREAVGGLPIYLVVVFFSPNCSATRVRRTWRSASTHKHVHMIHTQHPRTMMAATIARVSFVVSVAVSDVARPSATLTSGTAGGETAGGRRGSGVSDGGDVEDAVDITMLSTGSLAASTVTPSQLLARARSVANAAMRAFTASFTCSLAAVTRMSTRMDDAPILRRTLDGLTSKAVLRTARKLSWSKSSMLPAMTSDCSRV